jgi:hypothetical protein
MVNSVVIENDGKEEWTLLKDNPDYADLPPEELREKIKAAGIVGLGGAAFPTAVKLTPPKEKPIDTIIINGAECEPYLTADYRLMVEKPGEIIKGLKILMKTLGVNKGFVGIEDNKPEAIEKIGEAAASEPATARTIRKPRRARKLRAGDPDGGASEAVAGPSVVSLGVGGHGRQKGPLPRREVEFHYLLRQVEGRWRIVDIQISGVSQLALYRSQFVSVIRNKGFDALVAMLKEKIARFSHGEEK